MVYVDHTVFGQSNPPSHIVILYDDEHKCDILASIFINEGLKRNQLCYYAMLGLNEEKMKKLSKMIIDYEENVSKNNLVMLDLTPYLDSILNDDFTPFKDLKKSILEKVKERSDKHVRFSGDLVSFLFKNKHFARCFLLEEWWQSNPLRGTTLCSYQNSVFNKGSHKNRERVLHTHDVIVPC